MLNWIKSWFIKTPTYLDNLPDDVLQMIGNYLSINDIRNILQVVNRENKLEYVVPEYKILSSNYPDIWLILTKEEEKWNKKHPNYPINRKLLLK